MILLSDCSSIRPIKIGILSEAPPSQQFENLYKEMFKAGFPGQPDILRKNHEVHLRALHLDRHRFCHAVTGRPLRVSCDAGLKNRTKLYKTYKR